MPFFTAVFHFLAFFQSVFALNTYHYYSDAYLPSTYGGKWKYLSFINLHFQVIYFSCSFANDLLEYYRLVEKKSMFKKVKDFFFASICFPCALAVFVSFWAVYIIDRELVHPHFLDQILPRWANHLYHTAILVVVLEVLLCHVTYPSRCVGLLACSIFELSYLFWILWVKNQSGIWVYSFMEKLEGSWFALLVLAEIFFAWVTYLLGEYLNKKQSEKSQTGSNKCE